MDVGKPNQYLFGPDLVISHDINNVDNVDSNNTTGNDPEEEEINDGKNIKILLKYGTHEQRLAMGTRTC